MGNLILPGVDSRAFLRRARVDGYSMQKPFIDPHIGEVISDELRKNNYLKPLVELQPTAEFQKRGMNFTRLLFETVNKAVRKVERTDKTNFLPLFSVRVFEPGEVGTTIHRNDDCIGPYAVGITLKGAAAFNVYHQSQLPCLYGDEIIAINGDDSDPKPLASMDASAGSAWTLYTENELVPHSSGLVTSKEPRELLLFYALNYDSE